MIRKYDKSRNVNQCMLTMILKKASPFFSIFFIECVKVITFLWDHM